ncbi:hypothetical protein, partial [Stenotrophomonas maltophilia]|uniref:hypothetical protein n=1 Tax=Stenotrophomonas maltophilia TaxID=40324 RepID=UPI0013D9F12C
TYIASEADQARPQRTESMCKSPEMATVCAIALFVEPIVPSSALRASSALEQQHDLRDAAHDWARATNPSNAVEETQDSSSRVGLPTAFA